MSVADLLIAGVLFVVGYGMGRTRPLDVLDHAAWSRAIAQFRPTRFLYPWFFVWCALHPGKAVHSFRHRKDYQGTGGKAGSQPIDMGVGGFISGVVEDERER